MVEGTDDLEFVVSLSAAAGETVSIDYSTQISFRSSGVNPPPFREPYAQHTLVGGNAHLLEILRGYRPELGFDGSTSNQGFDDQTALTRNFLGSAANLSVSVPQSVDDNLQFDIEVSNQAGRKIPSAYPSRRTWLHVKVEDNAGSIVFESGKPDSRGYLSPGTRDLTRLKLGCCTRPLNPVSLMACIPAGIS